MPENFTQCIRSDAFLTSAQYKQIRYFQLSPCTILFFESAESSFNGILNVDETFYT